MKPARDGILGRAGKKMQRNMSVAVTAVDVEMDEPAFLYAFTLAEALKALMLLTILAATDGLCRVTGNNLTILYIPHCNCARTNDRAVSDADARPDEGICTDPDIRTDCYWSFHEWHCCIAPIVCPSTQMRSLRNCCAGADRDRPECVKDGPIPDRALRTQIEIPGNGDSDRWKDMHVGPDFGSKDPQEQPPPAP